VPFGFLKRGQKRAPEQPPASQAAPGPVVARGIPFDGMTEEWRLVGIMNINGRLTDALNKREAISIEDVRWAPIDGSAEFEPASGLRSIDPYDLIIVLAGASTMPQMTSEEKAAHRVHKVSYDVSLEAPPFRVTGTVFLFPGFEPERLLERSTEMFLPVTDAEAYFGDGQVSLERAGVILINRFYLRGVTQIDKNTGEAARPLPGQPLGGISWQDKSR
jgi:hypothetical protein